jgi:hypothetical protein
MLRDFKEKKSFDYEILVPVRGKQQFSSLL